MDEDPQKSIDEVAAAIATVAANIAQMVSPMFELAVGYRRRATEAGFGDSVADEMALELHRYAFGLLTQKTTPTAPGAAE